jgi:hypothetical protein
VLAQSLAERWLLAVCSAVCWRRAVSGGGRCAGGGAGFRPDLDPFAVDPGLDRAALEILNLHRIGLAVDADA